VSPRILQQKRQLESLRRHGVSNRWCLELACQISQILELLPVCIFPACSFSQTGRRQMQPLHSEKWNPGLEDISLYL
jgi:hypothetical protein